MRARLVPETLDDAFGRGLALFVRKVGPLATEQGLRKRRTKQRMVEEIIVRWEK